MKNMTVITFACLFLCLAGELFARPAIKNTNFIDTPFYMLGEELRVVNRDGSMRSRRAQRVVWQSGRWLAWDWLPPHLDYYRANVADMDVRVQGTSPMRTAYERIEAVQCRFDGYIARGWGTKERVKSGQVLVREWNSPGSPCRVQILEPEEFTKRYVNPDGSEIKLNAVKTRPASAQTFNRAELTEIMRSVYSAEKHIDYTHVPASVLPRVTLEKPLPLPPDGPMLFTPDGGAKPRALTVPLAKVYSVRGVLYYNAPVQLAAAPAPGTFDGRPVEKGDLFTLQKVNGQEYLESRLTPLDVQRYNTAFLPPGSGSVSELVRRTLEAGPAKTQIRRLRRSYSLLSKSAKAGESAIQTAALRRAFYEYEEASAQLSRVWRARNLSAVKETDLIAQYLRRAKETKREMTRLLKEYKIYPVDSSARVLAKTGAGFAKLTLLAGGLELLDRAMQTLCLPQTASAALQISGMAERERYTELLKQSPWLAPALPLDAAEEAAQNPEADVYALAASLRLYADFIEQSQTEGTPQQALFAQALAELLLQEELERAAQ